MDVSGLEKDRVKSESAGPRAKVTHYILDKVARREGYLLSTLVPRVENIIETLVSISMSAFTFTLRIRKT